MPSIVEWVCEGCGARRPIEYATDKRKVRCGWCGRWHCITGLHVNGTPIIHAVAGRKKSRKEVEP